MFSSRLVRLIAPDSRISHIVMVIQRLIISGIRKPSVTEGGRTMKRTVVAAVVCCALIIGGCDTNDGGTGPGTSGSGPGTLVVRLTDAPATYEAVNISDRQCPCARGVG